MNERPVQRPDCRAIGAKPARLAACPASRSAEFGHCDQQGRGGDVGYAGNAGQDGEAIGEAHVWLRQSGGLRVFDGIRDLAIDLFEALSILTFQQRERQSFSAVLGGGSILHQGLASDVASSLFSSNKKLASGLGAPPIPAWLLHAETRIAASRRSVFASLPVASAKRRA